MLLPAEAGWRFGSAREEGVSEWPVIQLDWII
jgi:hypothetical protein